MLYDEELLMVENMLAFCSLDQQTPAKCGGGYRTANRVWRGGRLSTGIVAGCVTAACVVSAKPRTEVVVDNEGEDHSRLIKPT